MLNTKSQRKQPTEQKRTEDYSPLKLTLFFMGFLMNVHSGGEKDWGGGGGGGGDKNSSPPPPPHPI